MNTKKKYILGTSLFLTLAGATHAATNFTGGNMLDAANWSAGIPNSSGDTVGTVNVDGTMTGTGHSDSSFGGSTITVDNGAVITATTDLAAGLTHWIFNDATVNAGDDLFTSNGSITFNANSSGTTVDNFEANNSGSLYINGGTHVAGDIFGFQANAGTTFSFLGGSVTAGQFRFDYHGSATGTIGGNATATSTSTTASDIDGQVNILGDWTGLLSADNFSGDDWKNAVIAGAWTLDGVEIDASVFAANFSITNGGKTLSAIPEPSSYALLAASLAFMAVMVRRRH